MGFEGFGAEGRGLLRELRGQEDRSWLRARQTEFDDSLRGPARLLVEELVPVLTELAPRFVPDERRLRTAIAPMYRDRRFFREGSPFHDGMLIRFPHRLATTRDVPAFALRILPEGYQLRIGLGRPQAATMQLLREEMVARTKEWRRLVARAGLRKRFGAPKGPELVRPPRGLEDVAHTIPAVRLRALYLEAEGDWSELVQRSFRRRVIQDIRLGADFMHFVCTGLELSS